MCLFWLYLHRALANNTNVNLCIYSLFIHWYQHIHISIYAYNKHIHISIYAYNMCLLELNFHRASANNIKANLVKIHQKVRNCDCFGKTPCRVCMCVCMYVRMYVCSFGGRVHQMDTYMYVCMYVCMVCIYIYICTYVHIYIHTHTQTYHVTECM